MQTKIIELNGIKFQAQLANGYLTVSVEDGMGWLEFATVEVIFENLDEQEGFIREIANDYLAGNNR